MSFKEKVYEICRFIPKGKVATYGQIARLAGNPKASRAVGALMRINDDAPHTPCHRVVAADGSLIGYSAKGGIKKKKQMLVSEGVKFKKDKVDLFISGFQKRSGRGWFFLTPSSAPGRQRILPTGH